MNKKQQCTFTDCKENFTTQKGEYYLVRCPKCLAENHHKSVALGVCGWCGWKAEGHVTAEEDIKLNIKLLHELDDQW